MFHQVDEEGRPVVDLGHVLMCLNKVRTECLLLLDCLESVLPMAPTTTIEQVADFDLFALHIDLAGCGSRRKDHDDLTKRTELYNR